MKVFVNINDISGLKLFREANIIKEVLTKEINVLLEILNYIKKYLFLHACNVYIILLKILSRKKIKNYVFKINMR